MFYYQDPRLDSTCRGCDKVDGLYNVSPSNLPATDGPGHRPMIGSDWKTQ